VCSFCLYCPVHRNRPCDGFISVQRFLPKKLPRPDKLAVEPFLRKIINNYSFRVYSFEWWMNWKQCRRECSRHNSRYYPRICPEVPRNTRRTWIRVAVIPAKIRTSHLSHASQSRNISIRANFPSVSFLSVYSTSRTWEPPRSSHPKNMIPKVTDLLQRV
jgi:hypothetical protein